MRVIGNSLITLPIALWKLTILKVAIIATQVVKTLFFSHKRKNDQAENNLCSPLSRKF